MGSSTEKSIVCVQGLGFVGAAMAVAVSRAQKGNRPLYTVYGIDLPTGLGKERIDKINQGLFPFETVDEKLKKEVRLAHETGNLTASSDEKYYALADVIVVDIPLDVIWGKGSEDVDFSGFKKAIKTLAMNMKEDTLVIVETTVPPGTCEKIVYPVMAECFKERGFSEDSILLAHSYERVMPGADYYDSIVNFWRVFSGINERSALRCEKFLESIINTAEFPLKRLDSTTASETAKVLENSYRATTIAFMEEWGRFAESAGFDLFQVIDAIRVRPTHSNIRQPGFGVGGYCLTKDPVFAKWASKAFFETENDFEFCTNAVQRNNKMPLVTVDKLERSLGTLDSKKIALLGVSYRQDVGDTRYSPSEVFVKRAEELGATVDCFDPLVEYWDELSRDVKNISEMKGKYDAVVFAVGHKEFTDFDLMSLDKKTIVIDSNRVLSDASRKQFVSNEGTILSIGRGVNQ